MMNAQNVNEILLFLALSVARMFSSCLLAIFIRFGFHQHSRAASDNAMRKKIATKTSRNYTQFICCMKMFSNKYTILFSI